MPEPQTGEDRDDFLDRCMGDAESVSDFPDEDQRFAFCVSQWGDKQGGLTTDDIDLLIDRALANMKSEKSMETKSLTFEIKKEPDEDGIFEGYASTFGNVDQGMDVVERGAFSKSLGSGRKVKMLWQHDMGQPIGVWDEIKEDERGLFVRGRLLKDVSKGREAMALMRAGALDSMSIGYKVVEATMEAGDRVRRIMEVDLWEVSLVTFPMNESATVTAVKSIRTEREFEAFLREAGYSRKEAAAITLHGFKAITGQRDAVADDAQIEGLNALSEQISLLQEHSKWLSKNST